MVAVRQANGLNRTAGVLQCPRHFFCLHNEVRKIPIAPCHQEWRRIRHRVNRAGVGVVSSVLAQETGIRRHSIALGEILDT